MSRYVESLLGCLCLLLFPLGCGESVSRPPVQEPGSGQTEAPANAPGKDLKAARGTGERSQATRISFHDIAKASGVVHTYQNDEGAGKYAILESLGGGVAATDFDGDSRPDLIFAGGGHYTRDGKIAGNPVGVFRNRTFRPESEPLRFGNVSAVAGCRGDQVYSHGVFSSDFDNDGFCDFLITGYGALQLFRNQGDGTFRHVASSGLTDDEWSTGAAWADITGDGFADLFVVHYVDWSLENDPECYDPALTNRDVCSPRKFNGVADSFFLSDGDGTFVDATAKVGIRPGGKGLNVCAGDVNGDGLVDFYVSNDTVRNFLYIGIPDGRLQEVGQLSGTGFGAGGRPDGSMGGDFADVNGDSLVDIWVSNYENESFALYRNYDNGFFQHVSNSTGITAAGGLQVGWGTLCLDLDSDGDEDIMAAAGHVIRYPVNTTVRQSPLLFENTTGSRFSNVAQSAGDYMSSPHEGRGLAAADLDLDGDIDLVVSHLNEAASVLENKSPSTFHYVSIHLVGTQSARDPVGAVVTVSTKSGRSLTRLLKSGVGFGSSSSSDLFFGLGEDLPATVWIQWPSGIQQELTDVMADQTIKLIEGRESAYHWSSHRR